MNGKPKFFPRLSALLTADSERPARKVTEERRLLTSSIQKLKADP